MKHRCQCGNGDGYFVSSELVHVSPNDRCLSRCQSSVEWGEASSYPARVAVDVVAYVVGGPWGELGNRGQLGTLALALEEG